MEAKILREGEIFIIYLNGYLDYETALPFRQTCLNHLYKEKVVFNCLNLHFVGSKGITDFIETVQMLAAKSSQTLRFCQLSSEFRRVIESSEITNLEIYENEPLAKQSFYQIVPTVPQLQSEGVFSPEEELS